MFEMRPLFEDLYKMFGGTKRRGYFDRTKYELLKMYTAYESRLMIKNVGALKLKKDELLLYDEEEPAFYHVMKK